MLSSGNGCTRTPACLRCRVYWVIYRWFPWRGWRWCRSYECGDCEVTSPRFMSDTFGRSRGEDRLHRIPSSFLPPNSRPGWFLPRRERLSCDRTVLHEQGRNAGMFADLLPVLVPIPRVPNLRIRLIAASSIL